MLKGIPVILHNKTKVGADDFGAPIYQEDLEVVENVLVAPTTMDDVITGTDLYGKKAVFTLGIPKGDTHQWEDRVIEFFGHSFKSFGPVTEGIEEMVPLEWHKKVMVERYE